MKLANKFLILGLLLYFISGIMALVNSDYSLVIVATASIFLALGFFIYSTKRWEKFFKTGR